MWRKLLAEERERADKAEQEGTRLLGVIDDFERRIAATEARAEPDAAFGARYTVAELTNGCLAEEPAGDDLVHKALAAQRAGAELVHKALAAERARADEADGALAAERSRADEANMALVAERSRADEANMALVTERARADEADEALATERVRAHKMRDWVDELRGLLTTMPGRSE